MGLKKTTKLMFTLFIIAFLMRIIWMIFVVGDSYYYSGLTAATAISARNIANGKGYTLNFAELDQILGKQVEERRCIDIAEIPCLPEKDNSPNFTRPPGYAMVLAATFKIFSTERYIYARVLQAVVDSFGCLVLYLLVMHMSTVRIAKISAFFYALFPPIIACAVRVIPDAYVTSLYIFIMYFFVKAIISDKNRYYVIAGIVTGIAGYFRTEFVLFPIFLGLGILLYKKSILKTIAGVCVMFCVMLVVLLPWGIRNYNATGRFMITSTGTGMTLWAGIGEYPNKWGAICSDAEQDRIARTQGFANSLTPEANEYFAKKWLSAVQEDPIFYLTEVARRIPPSLTPWWSWGFEYYSGEFDPTYTSFRNDGGSLVEYVKKYYVRASFLLFYRAVVIVLLCLTLIGVWITRKSFPLLRVLLLIPLYLIVSHITTVFEVRYMIPSASVCMVFAAVCADKWFRKDV